LEVKVVHFWIFFIVVNIKMYVIRFNVWNFIDVLRVFFSLYIHLFNLYVVIGIIEMWVL
jgi:hypothetical protein